MLPALLLLLGLVQQPEPRLFLWTIIGLGESGPSIVVTVTPTAFGLVSGVEIKAIALQPLPTRDDPKPRAILSFAIDARQIGARRCLNA